MVDALSGLIDATVGSDRRPSYVHPRRRTHGGNHLNGHGLDQTKRGDVTSPVSYSGGALNGVVAAAFQPRAFTVSLSRNGVGAFIDRSSVTVTGQNVLGQSFTDTIVISAGTFPVTLSTRIRFYHPQVERGRLSRCHRAMQFSLRTPIEAQLDSFGLNSVTGLERASDWTAKPIYDPNDGQTATA